MSAEQLLMAPWHPDREAAAGLLEDPRTTATTVLVLAAKAVGPALFGDEIRQIPQMETAELWLEMEELYGCRVCEAAENRLNALMLALESQAFETEPEAFMAVCLSLADGDLGDMIDGIFELPTFDEVLWALAEVALIRGQVVELSSPVMALLAKIADDEDEGPDKAEEEKQLVLERMYRLQSELQLMGAPSPVVESIPRRMALGV
jgi:hypothetical protein